MIGAACDRCNQLGVCVVGAVNDGKCSLRWSPCGGRVQMGVQASRFVTISLHVICFL